MKRLILTLAAAAAVAAPMSAISTSQALARDHDDRQYEGRGHDRGRDHDRDRDRGYRQGERWDEHRHNGYYVGSRFYYGPPPPAYYGRPDFRPGYIRWERGGYLPRNYWGPDYVVYDYGRYGLHRPPYGYRWYNVNGDYVLAAIAGGLIADALIH